MTRLMHQYSEQTSEKCDKSSKTSIQHVVRHLKMHARCATFAKIQITKTLDEMRE